MKVSIKDILRRAKAATLLLLFSVYYAGATLCTHTHVVEGVTIVHSHIYGQNHIDGSTGEDGGHTPTEITLIAALQNFIADTPSLHYTIEQPISYVENHTLPIPPPVFENYSTLVPTLRGPPLTTSIG